MGTRGAGGVEGAQGRGVGHEQVVSGEGSGVLGPEPSSCLFGHLK